MTEQKVESEPIMVSIRCLVYNHEPYIRQCLDGFVMQKTNFRFEAIVHDDASTDGTAAIIREYAEKYPDIIKPIFETENQYSKGNGALRKIMDAHMRGKYIALCEGDDYWIDPLKLQKQVDYMEEHPECSMCHTSFKLYYDAEHRFLLSNDVNINPTYNTVKLEDVLDGYRIQTLTIMFKSQDFFRLPSMDPFAFSGKFLMGDTQLWYYLRKLGTFYFIPMVTSVYRVHLGSASTQKPVGQLRFGVSCAELRYYLCQKDCLDSNYFKCIKKRLNDSLSLYRCFNPRYESLIKDFHTTSNIKNYKIWIPVRKVHYMLIFKLKKLIEYFLRYFMTYNW